MKNLFIVVGIVLIAVVGYMVFNQNNSQEQVSEDAMTEEVKPSEDAMMEDKTSEEAGDAMGETDSVEFDYEITMESYAFTPSVLEAEAGQTLRIKVTTLNGMHDFVIDELDVASQVLTEGKEEILEITIPEDAEGEYTFYCSVGNHRALGMEGTLTVSPK